MTCAYNYTMLNVKVAIMLAHKNSIFKEEDAEQMVVQCQEMPATADLPQCQQSAIPAYTANAKSM